MDWDDVKCTCDWARDYAKKIEEPNTVIYGNGIAQIHEMLDRGSSGAESGCVAVLRVVGAAAPVPYLPVRWSMITDQVSEFEVLKAITGAMQLHRSIWRSDRVRKEGIEKTKLAILTSTICKYCLSQFNSEHGFENASTSLDENQWSY